MASVMVIAGDYSCSCCPELQLCSLAHIHLLAFAELAHVVYMQHHSRPSPFHLDALSSLSLLGIFRSMHLRKQFTADYLVGEEEEEEAQKIMSSLTVRGTAYMASYMA